jgi:hypothetical protein
MVHGFSPVFSSPLPVLWFDRLTNRLSKDSFAAVSAQATVEFTSPTKCAEEQRWWGAEGQRGNRFDASKIRIAASKANLYTSSSS